ncbi:MAG TPA: 3-oxoadipate enol-lactonase [Candidatus Angelobacter sp.]|nr:3-oxoadipate enol-lactonase [Candidatus Angelobacter sp.]
MPFANTNKIRTFYRLEGRPGLPVLVLSQSLGADHGMWDPQIPSLLSHFQVLRYDTRGHGASDVPPSDYSIEQLGQDVLGLADALGISKFAFCGLSMGGAVGQWLALNAADRLTALVLANTSSQFSAATLEARRQTVLKDGMAAVVDAVMQRFFLPETLALGNPCANSVRTVLLGTNPVGYAGCCAAIRDVNFTAALKKIQVPTLIIAGNKDASTPWEGHGDILAREIAGSEVVHLPSAHLSNIDRPRSFSAALLNFLLPQPSDSRIAGEQVRRAVLGDEHVTRALAAATDFTRDFQELITRYAWGAVWSRPDLDWHTRRLLVLALTAALGRWEEFTLHLRAGLSHDLEPCDVKEALLQTAIYAGVPAANTGFKIANEEIVR